MSRPTKGGLPGTRRTANSLNAFFDQELLFADNDVDDMNTDDADNRSDIGNQDDTHLNPSYSK